MNAESRPEANAPLAADLQQTLALSIQAAIAAYQAAIARLDPEQIAEVRRRLADGTGKVALFVTIDGAGATAAASVALINSKSEDAFTQHLLKICGATSVAAAPASEVRAVNLAKLN